jgi:hypothetical protein
MRLRTSLWLATWVLASSIVGCSSDSSGSSGSGASGVNVQESCPEDITTQLGSCPGFDVLAAGGESYQYVSVNCPSTGLQPISQLGIYLNISPHGCAAAITDSMSKCDEVWTWTRTIETDHGTYAMSHGCSSNFCATAPDRESESGVWYVTYVGSDLYYVLKPDNGPRAGCEVALTRIR